MYTKPTCLDDFEPFAEARMAPQAYDYVRCGADHEQAIQRNRNAFDNIYVVPRVLKDVSNIDSTTRLFGKRMKSPIGAAPSAAHGAAHPMGELATAAACQATRTIWCQSTYSTRSMEEVCAASPTRPHGSDDGFPSPRWLQLYVMKLRSLTEDLIRRALSQGYEAVVVTVDTAWLGKRTRDRRNNYKMPAHLGYGNFAKYEHEIGGKVRSQSEQACDPGSPSARLSDASITFDFVQWVRQIVGKDIHIILKGIMEATDAVKAVRAGADAIWVSNHGGRQLDAAQSAVSSSLSCQSHPLMRQP